MVLWWFCDASVVVLLWFRGGSVAVVWWRSSDSVVALWKACSSCRGFAAVLRSFRASYGVVSWWMAGLVPLYFLALAI